MRLKKYLISLGKEAQITLEYFILLCVIAVISILGSSNFFTRVGGTTNAFMNSSMLAMEQKDLGKYPATVFSTPSVYTSGTYTSGGYGPSI